MRKFRTIFNIITLILIVAFLLTCVGLKEGFISVDSLFGNGTISNAFSKNTVTISQKDIENNLDLLIIDENHLLPEDIEVETVRLSNGESVNAYIYENLQKMFDDARSEGIFPTVNSGYRSYERQSELYYNKIKSLENEGYSKSAAENETKNWIAKPGSSEHQLGIAVDIKADKNRSSNDEVYKWLSVNAHKYGFILRYPNNKVDITGINYEPWHYRYVGIEHAKKIYDSGLTLEEYLDEKNTYSQKL